MNKIVQSDNLAWLKQQPSESVDFIYIDPPFNTGIKREYKRLRAAQDDKADRVGFANKTYRTEEISNMVYQDTFDDYMEFLRPRLVEAYRILKPTGAFFLHLDYREVHYAKVLTDTIFGRDSFMNEIIWAYDYGARSKTKWPAKHDNILWYAKDPKNYTFNFDEMERIPYMAPGLVGPEKAALGKTPTDTHWVTIVPTNGKERTGYPTQKPLALLNRLVKVHTKPGDIVLDFFAGSGSTGESAALHDRGFILIDENKEAIEIMTKRLAKYHPVVETI